MPTQRSSLNRDYEVDDDRRRVSERRSTRRDETDSTDREISLGTGTILGIFFALAVTCGVFFGFGYQMGRKSSQTPTAAIDPNSITNGTGPAPSATQTAAKPSANNPFQAAQELFHKKDPATNPAAEDAGTSGSDTLTPGKTSRVSAFEAAMAGKAEPNQPHSSNQAASTRTEQGRNQPPTLVRTSTPATPAMAQNTVAAEPQPVAATATGTFIVQVAAVSHQEDAELLDSALRQRGYAVFVRQEPQDHLLHVQVGPFASRHDADLIRQRLLADGYNALLK